MNYYFIIDFFAIIFAFVILLNIHKNLSNIFREIRPNILNQSLKRVIYLVMIGLISIEFICFVLVSYFLYHYEKIDEKICEKIVGVAIIIYSIFIIFSGYTIPKIRLQIY